MASAAAGPSQRPAEEPQHTDASPAECSKPKESCVKHFDALWFCYSPVHQMSEYYRYGVLDSCQGHWGDFMSCLARKTQFGTPVPEAKEESIWQLRTREEAATAWRESFPAGVLPEEPKP